MNNACGNLYPKKVIADLLNLSERRIEQLAAKKIIPKAERGKYDIGPTVRAYVMYLQQKLTGSGEAIDVSELKDRKLKAETEEREAKAVIATITKDMKENLLVDRNFVVREWTKRCIEVRAAMLELPSRIGFLFSDPETRLTIEAEVEKVVYEILATYSRTGISTEQKPLDTGGTEGDESAGKAERKRVGRQKQNIN